MRLPVQAWDWPVDDEGAMKDVNRSTDDVGITPVLELTVPVYCKIVANHISKYLEVQDNSTADGANVRQNSDTGLDNQLWKLDPVGDGYYKLIAKHSRKCLEVNNSTADGANVQQNEYWDRNNQQWKFELVENVLPPKVT